jgi:very-short-patch-repair endonuclease
MGKATKINSLMWEVHGILMRIEEFKFHPMRKWRFDFAWPEKRVAVEIEGGVWTRGRHTRGSGYIGDMEKYNSAVEMGWRVLRYQPGKIDFAQIKRVLDGSV